MASFGEKFGEQVLLKVFLSALSGVLVHVLVFIKGEWHMNTHPIFWLHLLILGLVGIEESLTAGNYLWSTFYIAIAYLTALTTSITTYRVFFHPLSSRGIPGPLLAKVSKFWHVSQCLTSKNHLLLTKLQKQYGDIVRTGMHTNPSHFSMTVLIVCRP